MSTHEAQAAEQVTNGNHAPAAVVQKGEQSTPNDVNGVTKKEIPAENLQPVTYYELDQQANVKLTDLTRLNAVKPEVQSTPELTLVEQQNHTNTNQNHINKVADASHATSLTDRQTNKEIPLTSIEPANNIKPDAKETEKNTEVNDNHPGNDDNASNTITNKNNDPQHATSSNQAPHALLQVKDKTNSDITAQNQDQQTAGSVAPKANDVNHHNGKVKQPATHIDNKNENKAKAVPQSQPVARTSTLATVADTQKTYSHKLR